MESVYKSPVFADISNQQKIERRKEQYNRLVEIYVTKSVDDRDAVEANLQANNHPLAMYVFGCYLLASAGALDATSDEDKHIIHTHLVDAMVSTFNLLSINHTFLTDWEQAGLDFVEESGRFKANLAEQVTRLGLSSVEELMDEVTRKMQAERPSQ